MTHYHDAMPQPPDDAPGNGASKADEADEPVDSTGHDLSRTEAAGAAGPVDIGAESYELALFALLEQVDAANQAPMRAVDEAHASGGEATGDREPPSGAQAEQAGMSPGLLAALAAAQAQGGQPLADALLLSAADDQHDALLDALLGESDQPPTGFHEQTSQRASQPPSAPALPTRPIGVGQALPPQLSPGAQRALAHIFGAAPTGDGSVYAQRATPTMRRVAEADEAYHVTGEHPAPEPDE